ncbi:MAG: hypothetical protein JST28_00830 [Acidobacteria bacterium]|nr:hypothetical protein [Acidobacteriota bacterium]
MNARLKFVRGSFRFRRNRLAVLGLLFCALAALFAVEAKLAWYGPDPGPVSQISSSKLQATDAPRIIAEAISVSTPVVHVAPIVLVVALLAFCAFAMSAEADSTRQVFVGFSPQVFFRPPPSL